MTLERIKELNPHIKIYTTKDEEFKEFGERLYGFEVDEIIKTAEKFTFPQEGSLYEARVEDFEKLSIAEEITEKCFGELKAQIGYCYGHSSFLNAFEWHTSSEVNVAVTDLILIHAKRSDMENGKIDSSKAKVFFVEKGEIIEVYATSLHFCPCQVNKSGFGCVVALPEGTNTPLDIEPAKNPLMFRKNKWIIAHVENAPLIARGVVAGVYGENIEIIGE